MTETPSFTPILALSAHTSSCYAITKSPSGEYLAAGGGDALVSLWDTQEWICVRTFDLTREPVKSVDFSFDGSYISAGSDDKGEKKIKIAHVETGEVVHEISVQRASNVISWHPCRYVLAYSQEEQDALLEHPDSWSRGYFAQRQALPSDLTDEEMDAALTHALRPLLFTLGLQPRPDDLK